MLDQVNYTYIDNLTQIVKLIHMKVHIHLVVPNVEPSATDCSTSVVAAALTRL